MFDHVDKVCSVKLQKGGEKQFGPWLKAYIPRSTSNNSRGSWNEGRNNFSGWSGGSGKSLGMGYSKGRSGSDSDSWRKDKPGAWHQLSEKQIREEEVTSPLKKRNGHAQDGMEKNMAVGSEKEKEMWKKLTYETVGDMSGQKGEHMDFVDSKKDATTQQLPGEEGEKRENIVMHPTGNVANDGNSANKGAKRGVKFHRKERKGKKGDNMVLGVTVGGEEGR